MKTDQSSAFLLPSRDVVVILLLLPPLNRARVPQQPTLGGGSCAARRRARHSLGRLFSFPQGRRRHSPPSSSQPRDSPTATFMVCDGSGINILCISIQATEVHTTQELDTPITTLSFCQRSKIFVFNNKNSWQQERKGDVATIFFYCPFFMFDDSCQSPSTVGVTSNEDCLSDEQTAVARKKGMTY